MRFGKFYKFSLRRNQRQNSLVIFNKLYEIVFVDVDVGFRIYYLFASFVLSIDSLRFSSRVTNRGRWEIKAVFTVDFIIARLRHTYYKGRWTQQKNPISGLSLLSFLFPDAVFADRTLHVEKLSLAKKIVVLVFTARFCVFTSFSRQC